MFHQMIPKALWLVAPVFFAKFSEVHVSGRESAGFAVATCSKHKLPAESSETLANDLTVIEQPVDVAKWVC